MFQKRLSQGKFGWWPAGEGGPVRTLEARELQQVCQAWNWVQPNGQPRDMVCRGLLLALHRAGHIELPAKRHSPPNNVIAHRRVAPVAPYDTTPITGSLAALGPLEIRLVRRTSDEGLFAHLLSRHHYLGYSRPVGAPQVSGLGRAAPGRLRGLEFGAAATQSARSVRRRPQGGLPAPP